MPKVLIVEDDDSMIAALRDGFEYEGYTVALARDGADGLRQATESAPDVIILDVMLPKVNGLDVCRDIRKAGNIVPIIMLTARGQEIDKVLRSEEHTSELQSLRHLVCRLLLEKKKTKK